MKQSDKSAVCVFLDPVLKRKAQILAATGGLSLTRYIEAAVELSVSLGVRKAVKER
jgi:hypothetical protein